MPLTQNEMPRFTCKIGGTEHTQPEPKGIEQIILEDHVDMIGVAYIIFGKGTTNTLGSLAIGSDLELEVGAIEGTPYKFKGFVTEVKFTFRQGVKSYTVVAMDPLVKLAASRYTLVYEDQKDSDVASTVIGRGGCTAGTIDDTGGPVDYTLQRNESDLYFLKRLAARNGYLLLANEDKIDFKKVQFTDTPVDIPVEALEHLEWSWSTINVPKELTVYGWDYVTKVKVEGTATSGEIVKIGGGPDAVSETGPIWQANSYVSDVVVTSQTSAKAAAEAELNRLARTALRGRAIVQGRGDLHAGKRVKFSGENFDGETCEAFIISSRHMVDEGGFKTEIHFCGNTKPQ